MDEMKTEWTYYTKVDKNRGKAFSDLYWIQNAYRPSAQEYGADITMDYHEAFMTAEPINWRKKHSVCAPFGCILNQASNIGLINAQTFNYIHNIEDVKNDHALNVSNHFDFWECDQDQFELLIEDFEREIKIHDEEIFREHGAEKW